MRFRTIALQDRSRPEEGLAGPGPCSDRSHRPAESARAGPQSRLRLAAALGLAGSMLLAACGGSGGSAAAPDGAVSAAVLPRISAVSSGSSVDESLATPGILAAPALMTAAALVSSQPLPPPDPGLLLMLVPDGQNLQDARVRAWIDAALEEGVRLQPISDSAFLQLGAAAQGCAGLVLPDSLHVQATDALLAAVQHYTEQGGKTMLVFDFGALTLLGDVPVYPVPRSRLSPLAGVEYVLYEELRDRTTGLGPVVGERNTLRSLLVPPGKSLPYTGLASGDSAASLQALSTDPAAAGNLLSAAGISHKRALYLPVSLQDPGGARGFDVQQYSAQKYFSSASTRRQPNTVREVRLDLGKAQAAERVSGVSRLIVNSPDGVQTLSAAASVTQAEEAWSGYLLGPLIYPSYVTRGDFGKLPGQRVLARSPQFGLVAGVNPVGAGQVLFVNLPLTYLKGRTDALMMHGFLHYFAREVLELPHLSPMPNGVAGMTFDWHLDAKEAQEPTQKLVKLNVFNDPKALFSIEMTAGPDTIRPGDQLGWNLPKNKKAQQFLQTSAKTGHAVGSHGGWIHDFYGTNVSENNQLVGTDGACVNTVVRLDNYEQCLELNRRAVESAVGQPAAVYSAPEGNNPRWAMDWLEQRGVVATYFGGHTGLGATRQYRDGDLLNPSMWMFPVTPFGMYATFEEFQDYGVPKADVIAWYRALVDFNIAQNTSRMVYAHPAGAAQWSDVLLDLLGHVRTQSPRVSWYTSLRLARFMGQRQAVSWSQARDDASGKTVFSASHPQSLAEMTWRLPRSRYPQAPQIRTGQAQVDDSDARYWLVRATGGQQLEFAI